MNRGVLILPTNSAFLLIYLDYSANKQCQELEGKIILTQRISHNIGELKGRKFARWPLSLVCQQKAFIACGRFVIDQKRASSEAEAKRRELFTKYGQAHVTVRVAGHEAHCFALGPEPAVDDIDGRSPAVVVWHDGNMIYLVASDQLDNGILHRIAASMYG
jgi:hypothetical protein